MANEIPDLSETDRQRFDAFADAASEFADAIKNGDKETLSGAINQFFQVGSKLDHKLYLNSLHIPKDAGEHEEALVRLMMRIPDGWGRWISCDKGWYGLLAQAEKDLAEIAPEFVVHQIKEKFGTLRFYIHVSNWQTLPTEDTPSSYDYDTNEEYEAAFNAKHKAYQQWLTTEKGSQFAAAQAEKVRKADEIVKAVEEASATTCEICAGEGSLHYTKAPSPWLKTLCVEHALEKGFVSEAEYDAWWKEEEPRFRARQDESIRKYMKDHKCLLVCDPGKVEFLIDVECVHNVQEASEKAYEDYDDVFVGDDAVGQAYLETLVLRHAGHRQVLDDAIAESKASGKFSTVLSRPPGSPVLHRMEKSFPVEYSRLRELAFSTQGMQPGLISEESRQRLADS